MLQSTPSPLRGGIKGGGGLAPILGLSHPTRLDHGLSEGLSPISLTLPARGRVTD